MLFLAAKSAHSPFSCLPFSQVRVKFTGRAVIIYFEGEGNYRVTTVSQIPQQLSDTTRQQLGRHCGSAVHKHGQYRLPSRAVATFPVSAATPHAPTLQNRLLHGSTFACPLRRSLWWLTIRQRRVKGHHEQGLGLTGATNGIGH